MYTNPSGPLAAGTLGGGALAVTGVGSVWLILAAFALIALATAILRIVPMRKQTAVSTDIDSTHWR